jgi:hypothetical protein
VGFEELFPVADGIFFPNCTESLSLNSNSLSPRRWLYGCHFREIKRDVMDGNRWYLEVTDEEKGGRKVDKRVFLWERGMLEERDKRD